MAKSTTRITKGVKKSITKKKPSAKTKIKSTSRAHPVDNSTTKRQFNLRSLSMLNIDPEVVKNLWDGWNFSHLEAVFEDLRTDNQEKDFFVVTGPAYATLLAKKVVHIPSIVILIVPSGQEPPTYVLRKKPADNQDDEVIDFQSVGLGWKPFGNRKLGKLGEGVFALKNTNNKNTDDIATAILWTISQKSMKRKENGDLEIEIANFRYAGENEEGEVVEIDEAYSKGFSTYSDILDMHDMDYTTHVEPFKAAVGRGFNASRDKLEKRLTMLQNEFPNHLDYKMVKIFPQNAFETVPTENSLSYFNEFYGKAGKTYLKIDSDGQLIKLGGN